MDRFLHRYDLDHSAPTLAEAARDLLRRALAPAVLLWAGIVGLGLLIVGPLDPRIPEEAVNEDLVATRTPTLDAVTSVMSNIGGTEFIIAVSVAGMALLWWRTRRWWFAVVPGLAVGLQALLFVTSSIVVDRERPDVPHLDDAPPTSGYPSGHAGASTAFYLTVALLAQRIAQPVLRAVVTGLCLLVPLLVSFARLYRGMHYPSDVVVGLANGLVCACLAWRYLRRGDSGVRTATEPAQTRAYRARTNE